MVKRQTPPICKKVHLTANMQEGEYELCGGSLAKRPKQIGELLGIEQFFPWETEIFEGGSEAMSELVVALSGRGDTGKSTTLKMLMRILCETAIKVDRHGLCPPVPRGCEGLKNAPLCEQLASDGDVWAVFAFDNCKVGVTSQGDLRRYLEQAFENFYDCDIYICATHSRGGTIDFAREWAEERGGRLLLLQHADLACPAEIAQSLYQKVNNTEARNLIEIVKAAAMARDAVPAQ